MIRPRLLPDAPTGREPSDPYVRRFWTAAMGPGAVADLLRLIRSATLQTALPRPAHLPDLVRIGLAAHAASHVWVPPTIPDVPPVHLRRLPPFLRREHQSWIERENGASRPF